MMKKKQQLRKHWAKGEAATTSDVQRPVTWPENKKKQNKTEVYWPCIKMGRDQLSVIL